MVMLSRSLVRETSDGYNACADGGRCAIRKLGDTCTAIVILKVSNYSNVYSMIYG
jgi:hypothetical protein